MTSLKDAYSAVGKSYELQRAFRAHWAQGELTVIRSQRKTVESVTDLDDTMAKHVSIKTIMDAEGDSEAVVNHILECTSRHQAGKLFQGKPYLLWNTFTKRYDYLKLERPQNRFLTQSLIIRSSCTQVPTDRTGHCTYLTTDPVIVHTYLPTHQPTYIHTEHTPLYSHT